METYIDLSGLDALVARVRTIEKPDATLLNDALIEIIKADNRKGVLAGLDKDGKAMEPVKYRPVGKPKRLTARQKNGAKGRKGGFGGFGPRAAGLHNNLTAAEYRKLDGPPLAPRRAFSRVITNLKFAIEVASPHLWYVVGAWADVVSVKGRKFLHAHFEGLHGLPKRDLRGVRPDGMAKARKAAIAWMSDQVRWVAKGGSKPS